jgi:signal transduction histidine kinase
MNDAEAKLSEELKYERRLFHSLLESIPDIVFFKDLEGRFVCASRSTVEEARKSLLVSYRESRHSEMAEDLPEHLTSTERCAEYIIGKSDFDLFSEERARLARADEQRIIQTGQPSIGKIKGTKETDGTVHWRVTTKLPLRDENGKIIGTFGISKDVTATKQAEDKLAHERELFRALVDNVPDSICFKDLQSRFVRLSRYQAEYARKILLNRYQEEHPGEGNLPDYLTDTDRCNSYLIGKTDLDVFPEARARKSMDEEQEIIRTGQPVIGRLERIASVGDGTDAWFHVTKMPWRDEQGNIVGTFGVTRDITAVEETQARLEQAHQRLIETSRLAGMAEVATDVLHNVGNVLNSVNVSCSLTMDRVKTSKMASLSKVSALLMENRGRLSEFFGGDPRGQQIPDYLAALAEHLAGEQKLLLKELEQILKHIDHIKQIVAMQQSYAKVAGVLEAVSPNQLVEDALHINAAALTRHDIQVRKEMEETPQILTEKHKVLQILVNLIRNAKYALDDAKRTDKLMTLRVAPFEGDKVEIQVVDNGVGIPLENLTRIFSHGFTTRRNGHGFGLHSSALSVKELGGSLHAHSDGTGQGAVFTLILPRTPPDKTEQATKTA